MTEPAAPTLVVRNVGIGVVRVTVNDNGSDFYRVYRGTSHAPTSLRIDDMDGGVAYDDGVTEDTTYYYRAKAINIIVVDEEPTEDPSAYGPEKAIRSTNDTSVDDPDSPTGALLANRHTIAGGG